MGLFSTVRGCTWLYLALPGFTWLYLALPRSAMIYLTIDCYKLPLTGLTASVYTGLNAQKLIGLDWIRLGMGWKSLKAPLI